MTFRVAPHAAPPLPSCSSVMAGCTCPWQHLGIRATRAWPGRNTRGLHTRFTDCTVPRGEADFAMPVISSASTITRFIEKPDHQGMHLPGSPSRVGVCAVCLSVADCGMPRRRLHYRGRFSASAILLTGVSRAQRSVLGYAQRRAAASFGVCRVSRAASAMARHSRLRYFAAVGGIERCDAGTGAALPIAT